MTSLNQRIEAAKSALEKADFVVIGGGAGLSAAAGLEYGGKRFTENFAPFIKKYGMTDMYTAGFYPFASEEERWGYWAKHILLNRFEEGATELYRSLFRLVQNKNYTVITTNVDSQFEKAGFPAEKIFEVQGNYAYLQCAKGCHEKLYYDEELVRDMVNSTVDCKIPTELIPRCPVCGGNMNPHLRVDDAFVQNAEWHSMSDRYDAFLDEAAEKKTVYLELGVGYNTPGIIRFPFEQMVYANPDATLIRLNREYPAGAKENVSRTVFFTEDMKEVLESL